MTEVVLAACADDRAGILATDLRTGGIVTTFEEAGAAVPGAFGSVGVGASHIYAVQARKALWQVWNWGEKRPSYRASLPEKLTAMAFSNDASLCFGGAASGTIYAWLAGTGSLLRSWPAHFREVTQLLVSVDGGFLISSSADATVQVYNLADLFSEVGAPKPFQSWSGHSLAVTSLALLPGPCGLQQAVATASLDRSVRVWDVATGQPLLSRSMPAPVHSLAAMPSGTELLAACGNGEMRSIYTNSSAEGGIYAGHTGAVLSCAVSADGSRLASCSDADRVRVWETRTRQCVAQVHSSRNVQVTSVRIVRRACHVPGPPPFQPFQRLLTSPEEVPPVPLCLTGRSTALADAMAPHTKVQNFLEQVEWAMSAATPSASTSSPSTASAAAAKTDAETKIAAGPQELEEQLAQARAGEARWARIAAQLYGALVDTGGDATLLPAAAAAAAAASAAAASAASQASTGAPSSSTEYVRLPDEPDGKSRKKPVQQGSKVGKVRSPASIDGAKKRKKRF
eukprot:TRINITY_DN32332_c0_g1_i1.p1 TRINITY_DN32332_c0_g1~~TRINITY_DN32332_c0_g1_i1.p1  ORF type:complete len:512 (+),score=125.53 TRINITY_DN32332_c0_g1_i1:54-1589(+)